MLDKLLRLNLRKLLLIAAAWVLCVILHNAIFALLRDSFGPDWDEPFFLILAVVVIPLHFVVSLVYTIAAFSWCLNRYSAFSRSKVTQMCSLPGADEKSLGRSFPSEAKHILRVFSLSS